MHWISTKLSTLITSLGSVVDIYRENTLNMNKLMTYFKNLWCAICGKPMVVEQGTPHVVTQPLNKGQIQHLENLFKLPVYTEGMTLTAMAHRTGQYQVVEFIKTWSARGGKL